MTMAMRILQITAVHANDTDKTSSRIRGIRMNS